MIPFPLEFLHEGMQVPLVEQGMSHAVYKLDTYMYEVTVTLVDDGSGTEVFKGKMTRGITTYKIRWHDGERVLDHPVRL